jgi:hypothetical protein
MSSDKSEIQFDNILRTALKKHDITAPPAFSNKVLTHLTKQQEQKILADVVLQKRLALAGFILVTISFTVMPIIFPTSFSAMFQKIVSSIFPIYNYLVTELSSGGSSLITILAGCLLVYIIAELISSRIVFGKKS